MNNLNEPEREKNEPLTIPETEIGCTEELVHTSGQSTSYKRISVQNCEELTKDYPENPMAWFKHGLFFGEFTGCPEDAELPFRKALALQPDLPMVWKILGDTLSAFQLYEESEQCLRNAIRYRFNYYDALLLLGSLLWRKLGRPDEAIEVFNQAAGTREGFHNPEVINDLAELHEEQCQYLNAAKCHFIMICSGDDSVQRWDMLCNLLINNPDIRDDVTAFFRGNLTYNFDSAYLCVKFGRFFQERLGWNELAIDYSKKARELEPENPQAWDLFADALDGLPNRSFDADAARQKAAKLNRLNEPDQDTGSAA